MEIQPYNESEGDDLFQIMKAKMSSEQEQIFMISHYLYLQHGSDSTKFVVDFDDVWKNVEFTRRDSAKRILVKNFTEQTDYKIAAPLNCGAAIVNGKNLGGAGQNKETILLTVDCFKNFCMIAATPRAKVIRSYYVKMENIMHEYYKNFKNKNNELQNSLQFSQKETSIKRHEVLIESNKNKWVVYFCKVQLYNDGSFILKIGETTDIKSRIDALRCDFGMEIILLNIFVCENSIRLEKSLHNSAELLKYKYAHLQHKNKKCSKEAYHIPNQKEYDKIVKFTIAEMYKYNSIELYKLRIEEKKIDSEDKKVDLVASLIPLCQNATEMMNILNKITSPLHVENNIQLEIETELDTNKKTIVWSDPKASDVNPKTIVDGFENTMIENKEEDTFEEKEEVENTIVQHNTANSTGPIVQIYHKNDLTKVVQVYNSIMEATRDFNYNDKSASFTAIKKAFQNKTIYLDYRWHFISNRQEPNLDNPRDIGKTVITQERNTGQVAMLNIDKTKIIKVFPLAKDASKEINQHPSAMCTAIKYSAPLNNHYWFRWGHVDISLQEEFLKSGILTPKLKNIRGIKIAQLHPETNQLVKTFASYTDVQKELGISVKKIKDIIENNELYKGLYKFALL